MKNPFAATAWKHPAKNGTVTLRDFSEYPKVPSDWPSRAVRRAVQKGREFRLSAPWRALLTTKPAYRPAIKAMA